MEKSRYTDGQILPILKQNETGVSVPDLCREHGMSDTTFYNWCSKFGGMNTSLMKRLKKLEEENRRLKKMLAEEKLIEEIAREAIEIKVVKPSRRKEMALRARAHYGVSIRVACLTSNISETCYS